MIIETKQGDVLVKSMRLDRYLEDRHGTELIRRKKFLREYEKAIGVMAQMAAELQCGLRDVSP